MPKQCIYILNNGGENKQKKFYKKSNRGKQI